MLPFLHGKGSGDGWCFSAAEAVRQLPGPPLEDPPTSPPHEGRGRSWGERGGSPGARAARGSGDAAMQPVCHQGSRRRTTGASGAAKSPAHDMSIGDSATGVTPSEAKPSDWRGGRAGAITSSAAELAPLNSAARHRARRVTRVTIWPRLHHRSAAAPPASACSSSGFVHAQREGEEPAIPGHGKGRTKSSWHRQPLHLGHSAMQAQPGSPANKPTRPKAAGGEPLRAFQRGGAR